MKASALEKQVHINCQGDFLLYLVYFNWLKGFVVWEALFPPKQVPAFLGAVFASWKVKKPVFEVRPWQTWPGAVSAGGLRFTGHLGARSPQGRLWSCVQNWFCACFNQVTFGWWLGEDKAKKCWISWSPTWPTSGAVRQHSAGEPQVVYKAQQGSLEVAVGGTWRVRRGRSRLGEKVSWAVWPV